MSDSKEVKIYGVLHKIGNKGFVYMHINGDWVRSSKTVEEFENQRVRMSKGE